MDLTNSTKGGDMTKKKVWRYYCDFCKKSGCSVYHIQKHEAACTNNPDRQCGICKIAELDQAPMDELIAALGTWDKEGLKSLKTASDGCPVCILAAIRQSKLQLQVEERDGYEINFHVDFNYEEAKADFWSGYNDEKAANMSY